TTDLPHLARVALPLAAALLLPACSHVGPRPSSEIPPAAPGAVAAAPIAQARPEARPSSGGTAPGESENRPDEGGTGAVGEPAPLGTAPPGDTAGGWGRLQFDLDCSREDHARYYSWQGLGGLALGLALAAPLANTPADHSVRRWYADKVHSDSLDALATA